MKKKYYYFLAFMTITHLSFSQANTFKNLDFNDIFLKLYPNSFVDKKTNTLLIVEKCSNDDTLSIVIDTLFNFVEYEEEKALFIFTKHNLNNGNCHACSPTTGFFILKTHDKKEWEYEVGNSNLSQIGEWGIGPKYKLLKIPVNKYGNEHGILAEYDASSYFTCELFDFYSGKIFSLYSTNDTTGESESINESITLKKTIYTSKSKDHKTLLCVRTKGHKEKRVKVDFIEYYEYSPDYNFFISIGKYNIIKK